MTKWDELNKTAKNGMVVNRHINEEARKLVVWLRYYAWRLELDVIDQEYDGASDASQGPLTTANFIDYFQDHLSSHEGEDAVSEEFCPFCDWDETMLGKTADEYEAEVMSWIAMERTSIVDAKITTADCQKGDHHWIEAGYCSICGVEKDDEFTIK